MVDVPDTVKLPRSTCLSPIVKGCAFLKIAFSVFVSFRAVFNMIVKWTTTLPFLFKWTYAVKVVNIKIKATCAFWSTCHTRFCSLLIMRVYNVLNSNCSHVTKCILCCLLAIVLIVLVLQETLAHTTSITSEQMYPVISGFMISNNLRHLCCINCGGDGKCWYIREPDVRHIDKSNLIPSTIDTRQLKTSNHQRNVYFDCEQVIQQWNGSWKGIYFHS